MPFDIFKRVILQLHIFLTFYLVIFSTHVYFILKYVNYNIDVLKHYILLLLRQTSSLIATCLNERTLGTAYPSIVVSRVRSIELLKNLLRPFTNVFTYSIKIFIHLLLVVSVIVASCEFKVF